MRRILLASILILCMSECLHAQNNKVGPRDSSTGLVQDVKDYSKKDNFFSRLVKQILVKDDDHPAENKRSRAGRNIFKTLEGKVIREIHIEVLDVFGGSVHDP